MWKNFDADEAKRPPAKEEASSLGNIEDEQKQKANDGGRKERRKIRFQLHNEDVPALHIGKNSIHFHFLNSTKYNFSLKFI